LIGTSASYFCGPSRAFGETRMPKKEDADDGCAPPGSLPAGVAVDEGERACLLCGGKMYFAKELRVHVCLNKDHGVLAYYSLDECYFTSQEKVAAKLAKEGKKFHVIEPSVLQMIGVEP
jgi:hypothetical protein